MRKIVRTDYTVYGVNNKYELTAVEKLRITKLMLNSEIIPANAFEKKFLFYFSHNEYRNLDKKSYAWVIYAINIPSVEREISKIRFSEVSRTSNQIPEGHSFYKEESGNHNIYRDILKQFKD
jgi:hypothetical protein